MFTIPVMQTKHRSSSNIDLLQATDPPSWWIRERKLYTNQTNKHLTIFSKIPLPGADSQFPEQPTGVAPPAGWAEYYIINLTPEEMWISGTHGFLFHWMFPD